MSWQPVSLDFAEQVQIVLAGSLRHFNAATKGLRNAATDAPDGDDDVSLERHINGAGGELAVAKLFGRYWGGHIDRMGGAADLGEIVQVRTRSEHWQELIVRDKDADDHAFVHVTGVAPHYRVWGWLWGHEAKQPEWRKEHGGMKPAYFPPTGVLHDIRTLPFRRKQAEAAA